MGKALGWLAGLLGVVALVTLVGVFALDGVIRAWASDRVAGELQTAVPFTDRPTVDIEGYPFVWRAVNRSFPGVRVRAAGMPVQADADTTVPLHDVDVTLTDVVVGTDAVGAATLDGTGRLTYDDLSRLAADRIPGARISHAGGDRVGVEREVDVLGTRLTVRATARPVLDPAAQSITLGDTELHLGSVRVPPQATQALVEAVTEPFGVRLPYGLRLDAVTPAPDGLRVAVVASQVSFPLR